MENEKAIVKIHFPELFQLIGADCYQDKCRQGRLRCNK